ncbi:hypothetical protein CHH83_02310 [Bacillus sp. 7586-K]|nr:hypothetical protein CHH83_02310 [Bacillus sp. 7586-K]
MIRTNLLFHTNDLRQVLEIRQQELKNYINNENEDYILNVGQEQYFLFLKDKFYIEPIILKTEEAEAVIKEEKIKAEYFPSDFYVRTGKSYPREVYYFYIPFEGERDLFKFRPSTYSLSPPRASIEGNYVVKGYIQFRDEIDHINREYESFVRSLVDSVKNVNRDVEQFNSSLENNIKSIFNSRKELILKRRKQHEGLIVPIRKKSNVSSTFSVPSPKVKKKINIKPAQSKNGYTPVPTLNKEEYFDILKIINDMGKEFERKPSVYKNKGEEDLRDHFLMMLEPNFEGSATGETFNKSGKTDILLRFNGSNVFVGECKFWTGKKGFIKTIDQLLGYLTWRDSKTAVIMFVNNKDFTNVVNTAKESISEHPNFIKFDFDSDESWFNYTFHITGDKNKEIKMALMLYHTP